MPACPPPRCQFPSSLVTPHRPLWPEALTGGQVDFTVAENVKWAVVRCPFEVAMSPRRSRLPHETGGGSYDGSRRKQGQFIAALNSAHERLREVAEKEHHWHLFSLATSNMLWNWDFFSNKVERNQAFETAFGYAWHNADPDIGWWVDRLHHNDRARVIRMFETARHTGANDCAYEYRFRTERLPDRVPPLTCEDDKSFIFMDFRELKRGMPPSARPRRAAGCAQPRPVRMILV